MLGNSLYGKRKRPADAALKFLINAAAALTVTVLAGILLYILVNGLPYVSWTFLSTAYSETDESLKGILPMLINTMYIVGITLLISAPIGISTAIYLTQYAKQGRFVKAIRFTTEVLSGIPSILFGLFGYTVFCILFRLQTSILAGCLTMSITVLPTIIRTTEEALLSVPDAYKEGAMALGAGKLRVVMGMVLPCALPGVLTAVILAMGRIVGESAALLFTSGLSYNMPRGFFRQIFASGRTLTLHLYQTAREASSPDAMHIAFATAAVLLILVFLLNRIAELFSRALRKG
ncbi:phosphate ABC transporter permease PstA [Caproiciproducens galactitolivorans]|uniref:Phosphate transport system permease protein PstA n=1 Tax=Caproiciproducens galactitolivorans TaxID=642589 RepID=A0A4Z0XXK0_9FIRM|nr:phosphate ABC transporter permease PstA [Caproiciproducens galactitolivorans]QEY33641.1 phosphate ABC transporter permease PstA [Caproiciproducens galactitolivorans]TGJ76239.1 phosphate transport system permease protein PstA [Caproiciproducens galactitolivorans]